MEILPGIGVTLAKVGESRDGVERRIGKPMHGRPSAKAVYATTPMLVLSYTPADTVELVEIGYCGDGRDEVFFDEVQLTFRFLDEVVADLNAKGHTCTPSDIGFDFHAGFAIWSMGSLWARDLESDAEEDDERGIVEGVSVAPYSYWHHD